jgi:hypothetical protein
MYKIPRTPRRQMALSLQLIADEFDNLLWSFDMESRNQARFFCFRVFTPGEIPEQDVLYVLREEDDFPCDLYPYLPWDNVPHY